MNKIPILFVNHKAQKCGVYEFGRAIGDVLVHSQKYNFIYREADTWKEFYEIYQQEKPIIIIYNYYPCTMEWIGKNNGFIINSHKIPVIQVGILHEVTQEIADNSTDIIFDYHIAADPTLLLKNPIVYKTGRLIPHFETKQTNNKITTIGSFGFATSGKGFINIIDKVQEEFDEAVINLNISFAKFADENGENARKIAHTAYEKLSKKGIQLNITHDHLSTEELLKFLAKNDLNVFLYEQQENRGISSATDWAIAVKRPMAITKSSMFRHLFDCYPSICIEDNSLKTILENGGGHLERLCEEWSPENLLWDYERIIDDIINKNKLKSIRSPLQKRLSQLLNLVHLKRVNPFSSTLLWLKKDDRYLFDGFIDEYYSPINSDQFFNRILDNKARETYKVTLEFLKKIAPEIDAKKIPEANIQQAFVFDTVYNLSKSKKDTIKILAVGAFQDTAAIALKKLGFQIEFIDPVINYDLSTYTTKPSVKEGSFDMIIATSVIEHVEDDEKFIKEFSKLIKLGGSGIFTCDFKDDYKKGDDIPGEDYRLYTKKDLNERLLNIIPNCKIIGNPEWECNNYDFLYLNRYRYTFASFVFSKVSL